jgi:DNA repair protein SbcC/Rad50
MRLLHLRLQNFRQHADTEIDFRPGLTGIIGPNGAGKSTILEAIAWAIYGSAAARGTNDTIRFSRAPARSRVSVELIFELAQHEFRVVRTLNSADLYLDGATAPVATTLGGVTEYLVARIGMSREEFFNTYFTGQKELQFLAQMGAAQRARFLGQVLGYERLKIAQERARARRNELRHEIEGIRSGLPDPDLLLAELQRAEAALAQTRDAVEAAEREHRSASEALHGITPLWEKGQRDRDRDRELAHIITVTRGEEDAARRESARAHAELVEMEAAEAELVPLREQLLELPDVTAQCERMSELARIGERRRALEQTEKMLVTDLVASQYRVDRLEQAPAILAEALRELEELRAGFAEAEAALEAQLSDWMRDRQEVDTKLDNYRQRAQELKEQIEQLQEAGPDGICPTCEQPLGGQYDRVLGKLQDEWVILVQDGKWLKQRQDQLKAKPASLDEAEQRRQHAAKAVEEKAQRAARCERAIVEHDELQRENEVKQRRLEKLRAELAAIPAEYDAEMHQRAEKRLAELHDLERRLARLEQVVADRERRTKERDDAAARADAAAARIKEAEAQRLELAYDEAAFQQLVGEHERVQEIARKAELAAVEVRGARVAAEQTVEIARRAEAAYRERKIALDRMSLEMHHHRELDEAFSHLRTELNARVRPELGELASSFLTEITDGRYTQLDIDESYNVMVLDEGEEKPVISGGEEDIANLVLRLAISQMIAERAGHPLTLLILDEVFGSLDVERRDRVVQLLHRLEDRFDQVILITHVETLREGIDQVIRVRYDERAGASVVTHDEALVA